MAFRSHDSLLSCWGSGGLLGWLWGSLWLSWGSLDLLLLDWSLTTHLDDLAGKSLLLTDGVLGTTSLTLGLDLSNTDLLSLELVDSLNQVVLVLELVTLGTEVELVVDVLVDLLGVTVSLEETSQNTGSSDGEDLGWHTGITGTLLVTGTLMTALSLLGLVALNTGTGVHGNLSSHDETVFVHLSDVLTGVGKLDLVALIWIHPDALLTTSENLSSKSSLVTEQIGRAHV